MDNYEEFTIEQQRILDRYVSNTTSNVFALQNLPEVVKGALFSRYSRSLLGLRALLLKEFIGSEDAGFNEVVGKFSIPEKQQQAIQKAQSFYDRILDGYGDDSIGELGGAHLAIEHVSMLAAKAIEDCRIGGSPLEKSTRYIYFHHKHNGEYLFYREPKIMTSRCRDLYINTCNALFETYGNLIEQLTDIMERDFPREEGVSKTAYGAALRARVLDCIRGILPAGALTNVGLFGNGRFFETFLQKMQGESLQELRMLGEKGFAELSKVIPSFVRRAEKEHRHQKAFTDFRQSMKTALQSVSRKYIVPETSVEGFRVSLLDYERDAVEKIIMGLLFSHTAESWESLEKVVAGLSIEQKEEIISKACDYRENRRHKAPRATERAFFTFEIVADFGVYRDLQRHRMLTQERQRLTCDLGYAIPEEILGTSMEKEYRYAMQMGKEAYETIREVLPEEAQYVVPMAYNIRWYYTVNLRALQWLCELRSSPQGHPAYRKIAQEMAFQVIKVLPQLRPFFSYVDFEGHYMFGRLDQELYHEQRSEKSIR